LVRSEPGKPGVANDADDAERAGVLGPFEAEVLVDGSIGAESR